MDAAAEEYTSLEGLLASESYQVHKRDYLVVGVGTITTEHYLIASKDGFSASVFYNSKPAGTYSIGLTSKAGHDYRFINGVPNTRVLLLELERAAGMNVGYCAYCYYCDDHVRYCGLGLCVVWSKECSSWEGVS